MKTLITSSPDTLRCLNKIVSLTKKQIPNLIYTESKYWISFKSLITNRNCVYLQPQKTQIRLFTRLDVLTDNDLQRTPATHAWAEMYPSIFIIKLDTKIEKVVELIQKSFERDRYL